MGRMDNRIITKLIGSDKSTRHSQVANGVQFIYQIVHYTNVGRTVNRCNMELRSMKYIILDN